jgi:beta-glucosidase
VDDKGERSVLSGKYQITLAGAQRDEANAKSEAAFTVVGNMALPK